MPEINRQSGFGSLLWGRKPAPAEPAEAPASAPATPPKDAIKLGGPTHERFRGDATLAGVLAGQATLGKGARGEAISKVQHALDDMAFVLPSGVDGSFGPETEQALKNFQSAAGLPTTGRLDAATFKALEQHAPPAGKTAWGEGVSHGLTPSPELGKGKRARVVVDLSQHRAFLFDKAGKVSKIYGVRTGNGEAGNGTVAGVKIVDGKNNDPTSVSNALWPEAGGKAFGTRLLNLTDYNVETGKRYKGAHVGQELHGTYQDHSIGRDFSHGCVGLRNRDIEEIYDQVNNGELVAFVK